MKKTIILKKGSKIKIDEEMERYLDEMYDRLKGVPYIPDKYEEEIGTIRPFMSPHIRAQYECMKYNDIAGELTGYDCPICLNKGDVMQATPTHSTQHVMCICMAKREVIELREQSGLGKLLEECSFESFDTPYEWQKVILDTAKEFTKEREKWFFIGGAPGCGKTHLCTAISDYFLNRGIACKYMLWDSEVRNLNAIVNDPKEYAYVVNELINAPVLYIDDFLRPAKGSTPSPAEIKRAKEILGARYNAKRITILSSELSVADIIELDEAVGSRITQMTGTYNLFIEGSDKNHRLTGGEK